MLSPARNFLMVPPALNQLCLFSCWALRNSLLRCFHCCEVNVLRILPRTENWVEREARFYDGYVPLWYVRLRYCMSFKIIIFVQASKENEGISTVICRKTEVKLSKSAVNSLNILQQCRKGDDYSGWHDLLLELQAQAEAFFIGGLEHFYRGLWIKTIALSHSALSYTHPLV